MSCESGKLPYASKRNALLALRRMAKRAGLERRRSGLVSAYRCDHCNQWHLGHRAEPQRAVRAPRTA